MVGSHKFGHDNSVRNDGGKRHRPEGEPLTDAERGQMQNTVQQGALASLAAAATVEGDEIVFSVLKGRQFQITDLIIEALKEAGAIKTNREVEDDGETVRLRRTKFESACGRQGMRCEAANDGNVTLHSLREVGPGEGAPTAAHPLIPELKHGGRTE